MGKQEITNFVGLISFWKLLEKLLEIFSREKKIIYNYYIFGRFLANLDSSSILVYTVYPIIEPKKIYAQKACFMVHLFSSIWVLMRCIPEQGITVNN